MFWRWTTKAIRDGRCSCYSASHACLGFEQAAWQFCIAAMFGRIDPKSKPYRMGRPRYISPNLGSRGTFQASPGIRAGVHEIGGKFQVSTNAVNCPPWRFDGNELFCRSPDSKMMAVEVKATAIYHVRHRLPRELFQYLHRQRAFTRSDLFRE